MNSPRHHGQFPPDLGKHPMWDPTPGEPSQEEFVARCLLSAKLPSKASRHLSMFDFRVFAALCSMFIEMLPAKPGELTDDQLYGLGHIVARRLQTTAWQICNRVFAVSDSPSRDVSGYELKQLSDSLRRLSYALVEIRYERRDPELAATQRVEGMETLIGSVWKRTTDLVELDRNNPTEWGRMKGTTSLEIEIGHWIALQVATNRCHWLDLDLLRALGTGLAARLFVALEAFRPSSEYQLVINDVGKIEEYAIFLAEPALNTLGVGKYGHAPAARRALTRAGEQLASIDPAYLSARCEKRGGQWHMIVRRYAGPRTRTAMRKLEEQKWRGRNLTAKRTAAAAELERQRAANAQFEALRAQYFPRKSSPDGEQLRLDQA